MLLWGNRPFVLSLVNRVQLEPENRTNPAMVPIHLSPEESRAMAVTPFWGNRPDTFSPVYVVQDVPRSMAKPLRVPNHRSSLPTASEVTTLSGSPPEVFSRVKFFQLPFANQLTPPPSVEIQSSRFSPMASPVM